MALRRFNAGGKKQKELTDEQKQEMIFWGAISRMMNNHPGCLVFFRG